MVALAYCLTAISEAAGDFLCPEIALGITLKLEPVKNFTINSTFSYYLYQRHTYRYYPGTLPLKGENEGGEAYRAEWDEHSFSWETTAGYKFEKNGHAFDILGGFTYQKYIYTL